MQNRRPLAQQKQNSARNRQDNRLDRHNQEISEEEGEVGEDDEDDERNINAHFNNRGGPITVSLSRITVMYQYSHLY